MIARAGTVMESRPPDSTKAPRIGHCSVLPCVPQRQAPLKPLNSGPSLVRTALTSLPTIRPFSRSITRSTSWASTRFPCPQSAATSVHEQLFRDLSDDEGLKETSIPGVHSGVALRVAFSGDMRICRDARPSRCDASSAVSASAIPALNAMAAGGRRGEHLQAASYGRSRSSRRDRSWSWYGGHRQCARSEHQTAQKKCEPTSRAAGSVAQGSCAAGHSAAAPGSLQSGAEPPPLRRRWSARAVVPWT